jgi:hypothetical protein
MHIHEAVEPAGKGQPSGPAHDISDEKNFQAFDSVKRGERTKVKGKRKTTPLRCLEGQNGFLYPLTFHLVPLIYLAYSTARVSRMTLTLIWPG